MMEPWGLLAGGLGQEFGGLVSAYAGNGGIF